MKRDNFAVPPFSAEAEASLLGALMLDNEAIHRLQGLTPESFYSGFNGNVFAVIQRLAHAGTPFDVVTVFAELQETGKGGEGDELARLNEIAQYVPSAANLQRYAEIVAAKAQSRALMAAGQAIAELAGQPGTAAEQLDAAQMLLAKLGTFRARQEPQHIHESLSTYLAMLEGLSEGRNNSLATGIGGLDQLLNGGLRRGEVMVIGARPKHGKTALSLALARNLARRHTVLFLSQEMAVHQLMHRHTAAMSEVDLGRILRADVTDSDMWHGVTAAAQRLGELNLIHDEQCALTLLDVRRKAIQVKRRHGLDVLFVDFLQLMQGAGEENRNRELDVLVNGIKALAMDLQIAIVVMSQLSRKADETYHRPTMTQLRDSGAIEAAADQIALLFNDHAHPMSRKNEAFKGFCELEIVAHRNGPQGLVPLQFIGELQQFGDWIGPVPQRKAKSTGGFE